jgi:hypothetical protein
MSVRARIDVDVVFHDYTDSSLSVGTASEHLYVTPGGAVATSGTVGTSAISVVGPTSCSTFAVKNTGTTVLRLGGAINVPAGRLATIPTTATIQAIGGNGSYSCVWVG